MSNVAIVDEENGFQISLYEERVHGAAGVNIAAASISKVLYDYFQVRFECRALCGATSEASWFVTQLLVACSIKPIHHTRRNQLDKGEVFGLTNA